MPRFDRRRFLTQSSLTAAGLLLPFGALWSPRVAAQDYGPLVPDPDGILDLPEGFTYRVLERTGDPMDDGYRTPARPDGMACFEGEAPGTLVLMRNHEVGRSDPAPTQGAYGPGMAPPEAYDPSAFGAVTRVVLGAADFGRVSSNLVLAGTMVNCSGGPSPWGWLSCEEFFGEDGDDHGYVFLCPTNAASVVAPHRIDSYGRFVHEAAAIDPATGACYMTEDKPDGCVYRFFPEDPADPFVGTLQALRVVGQPQMFTSQGLSVGDVFDVEWVDIDDPTPVYDSVRGEAWGKGAARVARGEGIWFFDGQIYITSTNGGPAGLGQIFRLLDAPGGATLELIAQSDDAQTLDFPDAITVAPWGQVFIAEDSPTAQYIRFIGDDGQVQSFARNALSNGEFAGVCFSPDGRAMFLNMQIDGLTLVVTGPFPRVPMDGESGGAESGGAEGSGTGTESGDAEESGSGAEAGDSGGQAEGSGGSTSGTPAGDEPGSMGADETTDDPRPGMETAPPANANDVPDASGCSAATPGDPGLVALLGAAVYGLQRDR